MKAPREFVVSVFRLNKLTDACTPQIWRDYPKHYDLDKNWEYFKVREVQPDEPDWKSMAEELAEALEYYNDGSHFSFKAKQALYKFRKATGDK